MSRRESSLLPVLLHSSISDSTSCFDRPSIRPADTFFHTSLFSLFLRSRFFRLHGQFAKANVARLHVDSDRVDSRRCREKPNELIPRVSISGAHLEETRLPRYAGTMEFSVIVSICNSSRREIDSLFIFDFAAPMEIVRLRPSFAVGASCHSALPLVGISRIVPRLLIRRERGNRCGETLSSR